MEENSFVFWVGDTIQIDPSASSYDGSPISSNLKGNKFNWYVTEVDPVNSSLTLGAYRAFGRIYTWSPAIKIHENDAKVVELACRHSNTVIDPAVPPTCTESGWTEGKHCADCNVILVAQESINPLKHSFEYDTETATKVCTRCKYQETDSDRVIDFKGKDIRTMIKIIESMLQYNTSSDTPPGNPTFPVADPEFSSDISFQSTWHTDLDIPYLLFTPSAAKTDGTMPLIVWLHDADCVSSSEEIFRQCGLPELLSRWSDLNLQGFNAYVLCPRLLLGDWIQRKNSFFALLDAIITKYEIDPRKISLIGQGMGGTGVQFLAYQKPKYFSCQVIINGQDSGVDLDSMKDTPTKIYTDDESYSTHYDRLKAVFGEDVCTVLDCEHDEILNTMFTTSNDGISELVNWMLDKTTTSIVVKNPDDPEAPQEPTISLPMTVRVTQDSVELKSKPSKHEATADGSNKAYAGQQIEIVEVYEDYDNYKWGKLNPDIWKKWDKSPSIGEGDRWIPLEYTSFVNPEYVTPEYVRPICYLRFSSPFGLRMHPVYNELRMHNGVDLGANWGTPVYAATEGVVRESRNDNDPDGNGNYIVIYKNKNGLPATYYFHLAERFVSAGDHVEAGQLIGRCGSTGCSTGPHLHFGMHASGSWQNPRDYMSLP